MGLVEVQWVFFVSPPCFSFFPLSGTLLYTPCIPYGFPLGAYLLCLYLSLLIKKKKKSLHMLSHLTLDRGENY